MAAIVAAIAGIFWQTLHDLIVINGSASTRLALPVMFAIVWSRRAELSALPIRAYWPGLAALIAAGIVWLLGQLALVRVVTEVAVIAMIPLAVLTVLGQRWLKSLAFPLFFLAFAIPVTDPLVPVLVDWTAKFTFLWIQASGIPIHREGAFFLIPSGAWAIADACSGTRYLTTCVMLGFLYAWTMYRRTYKRALFVAGAFAVGIVGNWLRAYLTIVIAHLSDNRFLRDDHGTFGWILFAILFFGYCWLGWRFRDEDTEPADNDSPRSKPRAPRSNGVATRRQAIAVSAAALIALSAWPFLDAAMARHREFRPVEVADIAPERGWTRADTPSLPWTPDLQNPSKVRVQSFGNAGSKVDVFIGVYRNETWTSKLVTSVNQFADSDNPNWSLVERGSARTVFSGKPFEVKTGVVLGRNARVIAWRWYWVDGDATASDLRAKLRQLLVRLRGEQDTTAWVAVYTPAEVRTAEAGKLLDRFLRDMGESLERALVATTGR